jgi:2-polyprenyl-6-methoxyphenol hydroxylase-like FAD-dependent oxidoreductase
MLLAGLLHRAGVDTAVLEKRPTASDGSRAIGVHAPALRALEASGHTERLLAGALRVTRGEARDGARVLGVVRFDQLSTRFPFVATLPQAATEAALADGAPTPRRGVEVSAIRQDGERMLLHTAHGESLDARVVVVAGGSRARSLVFRPGRMTTRVYPDRYLVSDLPAPGGAVAVVHLDRGGVLESFPLPGGVRRFTAWDPSPADERPEARLERLRHALEQRGQHEAAASVTSAGAFRVRRAVAPALVRDRLFVIGDTAHEVSPIGGQGMNLGLLDAATLAPLLASWVRSGERPEAELRRWERDRLTSARTAARLAAANMALGRPTGSIGHAVRRSVLRGVLGSPAGGVVANAYAMGLDRSA